MRKLVWFLLFIATACSVTTPDISILDDPTCELPCWNGITPGKTTQPEALDIIEGLDGIDPEKTNAINGPWKIFNKQIWFYLYTDPSLAEVQTDGVVYFIDDKVAALFLQRNVRRTFDEMVELVGTPETIISIPFVDGSTVIMAIISTKGVMFEFYTKSEQLTPDTNIDNVMFFDFSHYDDLLDAGMFSLGGYDASDTKQIMYSWKGYGNIEELYPPRFP